MKNSFQFKRGDQQETVCTTHLLEMIYHHPDLISELTKRLEIQADSNEETESFVRFIINDMYKELRQQIQDSAINILRRRQNIDILLPTKDGE